MNEYASKILNWRQQVEASLRGEESWLALIGLHWLRQGVVSLGAGSGSDIRLPAGSAPGHIGLVHVRGTEVRLEVRPGVEALVDGRRIRETVMVPDTAEAPTRLRVGRLTLALVERGGRLGLRVWDRESPRRSAFPARRWFQVDPSFRIQGVVIPGWPNTRSPY